MKAEDIIGGTIVGTYGNDKFIRGIRIKKGDMTYEIFPDSTTGMNIIIIPPHGK